MKILTLLILYSVLVTAQQKQSIADLGWFSGNWEMIKGERKTEEFWFSPSGNILLGVSKTVKDGKLGNYEFAKIEQDSTGNIYYRVIPSSQSLTSFKLISNDGKKVIFENQQNDFPQRIIYERTSPDSLNARIEGMNEGKLLIIRYPYRKIKN
jgi:hypothetical protein